MPTFSNRGSRALPGRVAGALPRRDFAILAAHHKCCLSPSPPLAGPPDAHLLPAQGSQGAREGGTRANTRKSVCAAVPAQGKNTQSAASRNLPRLWNPHKTSFDSLLPLTQPTEQEPPHPSWCPAPSRLPPLTNAGACGAVGMPDRCKWGPQPQGLRGPQGLRSPRAAPTPSSLPLIILLQGARGHCA